jgi:hypothetical protein
MAKKIPNTMARNLLITTFGKYNHLAEWINGDTSDFDIALINYDGHQSPIVPSTYYGIMPTFKYEGIARMLTKRNSLMDYDYFFMPDEDILINADGINAIFAQMRLHNLDLAQPSVEESKTSFLSWRIFKHNPAKPDIINTDFIECMCPVFSRKALELCLPIFPKSRSAYGLDLVWPKLIGNNGKNIAIINNVVVKHTRPVGKGELYKLLAKQGVVPDVEMHKLIKEYDIKFEAKAHN